MSIAIDIENVIKRFGKDTVISGLSLDMRPGEFLTLPGLSEYGKTTLLRMIIGSNSVEGGEVKIDDKIINSIPTNKRNMGMVLQNYAIFPHMSVRNSVTFGLKNRKMPQVRIESQVDEILGVVKIDHLKRRMPPRLSDGQQQRMALARAVVIHPGVLLTDEPLSSLNARLCMEMRNAIKRIQQQIGIVTLYATHDQEEVPAVSDRIAVIDGDVVQQIDTPKNIYQRPVSLSVSTFIGLSNILNGATETSGNTTLVRMGDYTVAMDNLNSSCVNGQPVKVSVRPEELTLNREADQDIPAVVRNSVFLGVATHYSVEAVSEKEMGVVQNSSIWDIIPDHTPIRLGIQPAKVNIYNQNDSKSLIVRRRRS